MNRIILNETSYHGAGAVTAIVTELANRGLKRPIVFSDPDLLKFGVTKKVTDLLDKAKVPYALYSDIKPNPTIENVKNGVKAFRKAKADCIIAIGGGSSMDTAKGVGIIAANPTFADVRSLEGLSPTTKPSKPIFAVPTTAGTAAEVTINYVITDVEKKRKFVCVDPHDIPVVAFVDPDMMATMPKGLTAFTGMDALTHAIEGYITKGACPMTDMLHLEAIRLISRHLRDAVANKPSGRAGMALGQYIAGMGFSNVGLGVDHSMAHGLSALYDMPHGKACAILLMDERSNLLKAGVPNREAVRRAAAMRFRPILMSCVAALFGMLPMAFSGGFGAELRQSIGIGSVGGILVSSLVSLYFIPCLCAAFVRRD